MRGRVFIITMFVLLFIGAVVIIGSSIKSVTNESKLSASNDSQSIMIHQEAGVFSRASKAMEYEGMPEGDRSLKDYYDNRAYHGAPPMMTHPLLTDQGIGGKQCLQCHQNGGYAEQFKAFAPVTPHPDWVNCRQCHLPMESNSLFKNTDWEKPNPPKLNNKALATSPVIMPHGIQNRENCLACHAGPAAPAEIRVTHPERINCRQCHVPKNTDNIMYTPVESRGQFLSTIDNMQEEKLLGEKDKEGIKNWIDKENKK